jgi:hypothetical protein
MWTVLCAALAAAEPDFSPPPVVANPLTETEVRAIRNARRWRNAGTTMAIAGPPVGAGGFIVLLVGALGQNETVAIGGFVGLVGGSAATLLGTPIQAGAGVRLRRIARDRGGDQASDLMVASLSLHAATGVSTLFLLTVDAPAPWFLLPVGLYAGGVATGFVFADDVMRNNDLRVAPYWTPQQRGIAITGRF